MSRKGTKTITVSEEDHATIEKAAKSQGVGIAECAVRSVKAVASGELGVVNNGIDVEMLLVELAETKQRVSKLEDENFFLMKFLKARFPRHAGKLSKLIYAKEENSRDTLVDMSIFGQDDSEITTDEAIRNCLNATPVTVDPVIKKVGIFSKESVYEEL